MNNYPLLAGRLFNTPLLVDEAYLPTLVAAFAGHKDNLPLAEITLSDGTSLTSEQALSGAPNRQGVKPYAVHSGVAVINVSGTLVNKGSMEAQSGMMGYNGVLGQFSAALDDSSVESIIFDIDSPGGEVSGCFDLADLIKEYREDKPTAAFVGEQATSAAYALASACGKVYTPRTGTLGSIGVLVAHHDVSEKMEKDGIKVTLIHSGKHKVDGNPFEKLSDEVRENIQARIDTTRQLFAQTVASNRGMSVKDVLNTEAKVYDGQSAVDVGLADAVMTFSEVIQKMSNENQSVEASEEQVLPSLSATDMEFASIDVAAEQAPLDEVATYNEDLIELCDKFKSPASLSGFLRGKVSLVKAEKKLEGLSQLRDVLTSAQFDSSQIASIESNFDDPVALARALIQEQEEDKEILNVISPSVENKSEKAKVDFYDFQSS